MLFIGLIKLTYFLDSMLYIDGRRRYLDFVNFLEKGQSENN